MRVPILALLLAMTALAAPGAQGLLPLAPPAHGGDWPVYGHDLANSRDGGDQGISRLNAPTLAQRWSVDTGGDVTGTPAISNGRVFVGTYGGNVEAFDAATGAALWTQNVGFDVSSSPAVADGRVLVADHGGRVDAFDAATGAPLWVSDLSRGQTNVQLYGSPTPVGDDVVVGVSSLQETDATVSGFQGAVVKLEGSTGEVEWRTQTVCDACNGGAVWSTPAVDLASGTVFVGVGNAYTPPADPHTDSMMALSLGNGSILWSHQALADDVWTSPTGGPGPDYDFGASPNLFTLNGHLVVGEGQKSGQYHVVDAVSGQEIWEAKLSSGSSLGGFLGSTAYHDGQIFGGTVNIGTGQGTGPTDVQAQPTGGKVIAFSAKDGSVDWFLPKVPTLSAAAYSGGVVFQGDLSGTLYGFDAQTGAVLFAFPTGEPIESGPSIAEGSVFVGTGSGLGVGAGHHLMAFAPAV